MQSAVHMALLLLCLGAMQLPAHAQDSNAWEVSTNVAAEDVVEGNPWASSMDAGAPAQPDDTGHQLDDSHTQLRAFRYMAQNETVNSGLDMTADGANAAVPETDHEMGAGEKLAIGRAQKAVQEKLENQIQDENLRIERAQLLAERLKREKEQQERRDTEIRSRQERKKALDEMMAKMEVTRKKKEKEERDAKARRFQRQLEEQQRKEAAEQQRVKMEWEQKATENLAETQALMESNGGGQEVADGAEMVAVQDTQHEMEIVQDHEGEREKKEKEKRFQEQKAQEAAQAAAFAAQKQQQEDQRLHKLMETRKRQREVEERQRQEADEQRQEQEKARTKVAEQMKAKSDAYKYSMRNWDIDPETKHDMDTVFNRAGEPEKRRRVNDMNRSPKMAFNMDRQLANEWTEQEQEQQQRRAVAEVQKKEEEQQKSEDLAKQRQQEREQQQRRREVAKAAAMAATRRAQEMAEKKKLDAVVEEKRRVQEEKQRKEDKEKARAYKEWEVKARVVSNKMKFDAWTSAESMEDGSDLKLVGHTGMNENTGISINMN